jgi:hypothetical protein
MKLQEILQHPVKAAEMSYQDTVEYLDTVAELLKKLEEPVLVELDANKPGSDDMGTKLVIIGDTHGDYLTAHSAVTEFFIESTAESETNIPKPLPGRHLLFLGDYIDRVPSHCPNGSFINLMYVLSLKLAYPENVTLLRGNHEAYDLIPCSPMDLSNELQNIFGERGAEVEEKLLGIFKKLPMMFRTNNGLLAVHGGIFGEQYSTSKLNNLSRDNFETLGVLAWSEPRGLSRPRTGIVGDRYNYTKDDLLRFLEGLNSNVLVRGHTARLAGTSVYDNKCLTLFSTYSFMNLLGEKSMGIALAPLDKLLNTVGDLELFLYSRDNWLPVEAIKFNDD